MRATRGSNPLRSPAVPSKMFLEHSRTPDLEMEKTLTGLFDKANSVYEEMDKSGQADALFKASAERDVDHKPSIGSNCDFDNVAHEKWTIYRAPKFRTEASFADVEKELGALYGALTEII